VASALKVKGLALETQQALRCLGQGCRHADQLTNDPRSEDDAPLMANVGAAIEILSEVFTSATLDEGRERLGPFTRAVGGVPHRERHLVPAGRGSGPVRRRAGQRQGGPTSSTSTEIAFWSTSVSTWTQIIDLKFRGVVA
jgi:hypothetical protein